MRERDAVVVAPRTDAGDILHRRARAPRARAPRARAPRAPRRGRRQVLEQLLVVHVAEPRALATLASAHRLLRAAADRAAAALCAADGARAAAAGRAPPPPLEIRDDLAERWTWLAHLQARALLTRRTRTRTPPGTSASGGAWLAHLQARALLTRRTRTRTPPRTSASGGGWRAHLQARAPNPKPEPAQTRTSASGGTWRHRPRAVNSDPVARGDARPTTTGPPRASGLYPNPDPFHPEPETFILTVCLTRDETNPPGVRGGRASRTRSSGTARTLDPNP